MTNEQIFASIELTADQIRDMVKGVSRPINEPKITTAHEVLRLKCLVCHYPIGIKTCKMNWRSKHESR